MRVIAGTAKGHSLKCSKGLRTRPTLDRVREAVFNTIGFRVVEAVFLDLFAGTGAVGIEALSRGAGMCCFNDSSRKAVETIRQNLIHCRMQDKSKIFNMDALQLIRFLQEDTRNRFDLVYLDPPYDQGLYEPVLSALDNSGILKETALVVAESSTRMELPEKVKTLQLARKARYGDTVIWYYRHT